MVSFRDEGSTETHSFAVTEELRDLFAGAAAILAGAERMVNVSFSALLGAMLVAKGPTSTWMQQYVRRRGVALGHLFEKLRVKEAPLQLAERYGKRSSALE